MPCTLRLINWMPTSYSRSWIWRLSEGCAVCSRFPAASVRLPFLGERDEIAKIATLPAMLHDDRAAENVSGCDGEAQQNADEDGAHC